MEMQTLLGGNGQVDLHYSSQGANHNYGRSGIYRCEIALNCCHDNHISSVRKSVYVGIYNTDNEGIGYYYYWFI